VAADKKMETLEDKVRQVKQVIREHHGTNVADSAFMRAVDELISVFYDDIGEIKNVDIRSLFDLFVIKVLYIGRRSTDADVVDYLGEMLTRYLYTRELFPVLQGARPTTFYLSDLLEESRQQTRFQNMFEAYRKFADNALFVTGVFPRSLHRRRAGRRWWSPRGRSVAPVGFVDVSYYVSTGKTCYRLAAEHELAELTQQRQTLDRLATYFEVYMQALNEMSERYILGFDMSLIADKMLDNFNIYQRTGDERYLNNARKYAAILKVDEAGFPSLFRRRPRPVLLEGPPGL
jgi:hypothetical protein